MIQLGVNVAPKLCAAAKCAAEADTCRPMVSCHVNCDDKSEKESLKKLNQNDRVSLHEFHQHAKTKTPVEWLSNPRVHKDPPNVLLSTPPNARPDPCGAENDVEGHPGTASSRHATLHDMQVEHTLNKTKQKKGKRIQNKTSDNCAPRTGGWQTDVSFFAVQDILKHFKHFTYQNILKHCHSLCSGDDSGLHLLKRPSFAIIELTWHRQNWRNTYQQLTEHIWHTDWHGSWACQ